MKDFKSLGLPEALNQALHDMQFNEPTPIQVQAIPPALEGQDILGSAQTGTGKTAAFGIPLVAHLIAHQYAGALVMTPTRELATQVLSQLKAMLGHRSPIKTALLIGGDSMSKQMQQLRAYPRLLVGTPGRINDHLERRSINLEDTNFLVLDETDRMLDMGFTIQVERIMRFMPESRQTLLFSATLPKNIVNIATKYLHNPVRVSIDSSSAPASKIKQEVLMVTEADKYDCFLSQLDERKGSVIVFVKTKHGTERMAQRLLREGFSADAIHGDLRQSKRDRVISDFRNQRYRILVATDVAARGLDIPHIEHVINYDLPQCAEDYIHRIGRTARAGAEGSALCLIAPSDSKKWHAIDRLLNPEKHQSSDGGQKRTQSRRRRGNSSSPKGRNERYASPSSKRRPSQKAV